MQEFIRLLHSHFIRELMSVISRQPWIWADVSKDHNIHLNCLFWVIMEERWALKEEP